MSAFNEPKAVAMACFYLAKAPDHQLNDLRLMKLLYTAERESLRQNTASISNSRLCSMKNGPVLSEVIGFFKGNHTSSLWNEHIRFIHVASGDVPENTVQLIRDFDPAAHLSGSELAILESVWERLKGKSKWTLVEITHQFPEWNAESKAQNTSIPISLLDIFHKGLHEDIEVARAKVDDIEYYGSVVA